MFRSHNYSISRSDVGLRFVVCYSRWQLACNTSFCGMQIEETEGGRFYNRRLSYDYWYPELVSKPLLLFVISRKLVRAWLSRIWFLSTHTVTNFPDNKSNCCIEQNAWMLEKDKVNLTEMRSVWPEAVSIRAVLAQQVAKTFRQDEAQASSLLCAEE